MKNYKKKLSQPNIYEEMGLDLTAKKLERKGC